MNGALFFGLMIVFLLVGVAIGYLVNKLSKRGTLAVVVGLGVTVTCWVLLMTNVDKGLDKDLEGITERVSGITGEEVLVKDTPSRNSFELLDGGYMFLGKTKKYEVDVKDLEIQSILTDNEVVYRNMKDK